MLSIFPELYNYSQVAPFLLRLVVGAFFIISGFKVFFVAASSENRTGEGLIIPKIIGVLELIFGVFFLVGLFVQPAAMAVSMILIVEMIFKSDAGFGGIRGQSWLRLLLLAILLSLIILGPGIFSFDFPL